LLQGAHVLGSAKCRIRNLLTEQFSAFDGLVSAWRRAGIVRGHDVQAALFAGFIGLIDIWGHFVSVI